MEEKSKIKSRICPARHQRGGAREPGREAGDDKGLRFSPFSSWRAGFFGFFWGGDNVKNSAVLKYLFV
jgi:hypothetical protein